MVIANEKMIINCTHLHGFLEILACYCICELNLKHFNARKEKRINRNQDIQFNIYLYFNLIFIGINLIFIQSRLNRIKCYFNYFLDIILGI